jgi:hypothetical protein
MRSAMHDRFQFSIRSVLLLTALFAALLSVFLCKASPASIVARFIAGYLLMSLSISAIHITAGVARAFWIGVTAPLTMSAIWLSLKGHRTYWGWNGIYKEYMEHTAAEMDPVWRAYANELNVIPIACCLALINGLLCALVVRLIRPQRGPDCIPHPTLRRYGFFWLTVALVAIVFFSGGMIFDRWCALSNDLTMSLPTHRCSDRPTTTRTLDGVSSTAVLRERFGSGFNG